MSATMTQPGDSRRGALKGAITTCLLMTVGVQGWQLAAADWPAVAKALDDLIASPVLAAGTGVLPADAGVSSLPPAPPNVVVPPAPSGFASHPVAADLEDEMTRLLNELRSNPRPAVASQATLTKADLGRAAVSSRLSAMVERLETMNAQEKARAAGAAAEVAKSKAIFENMKPGEAAAIFVSMDDGAAAEIFAAMDERKAAAVLAAMPSDRAARITLAIRAVTGALPPAPAKRR
jgi:flagellar motility protein MotE (MotC chaperone)